MSESEGEEEWITEKNFVPLFSGPLPYNLYKVNDAVTIKVTTADFHAVPKELFASDVWGGAVVISDHFKNNPNVVEDKLIVEVGAAGALPSMVASTLRAKYVVCTDFPDDNLIASIASQFSNNACYDNINNYNVLGHKWGDTDSCKEILKTTALNGKKFDVVIVAECLWRDTYCQHANLLTSICELLSEDGIVFVAHTFHNPGYEEKDLEFFSRANNDFGLDVKLVETRKNMAYIDGSEADASDVYLRTMVRKTKEV
eukprot:g4982.t1